MIDRKRCDGVCADLAAVRVRFGYRRLTVLLRREGWQVNAKRIYHVYALERLVSA